ncbi:hypothetical protein [Nonomuraea sp. NPDC048901]|uniref:hypothetical protein n=1 Tax=Nonomuraea sp. NPDC048901 TaxID=3155627 RepID=UPI0033CE7159
MTSQQASQIDRSLAIVLAAVLSIVLLAVRFEERDTIALVDRIAGYPRDESARTAERRAREPAGAVRR